MGSFSIHSIGDSAFLEQILIAVSMITGTGDFEKMVSIGLLLGVLMICIQSVFQGAKQINLQQVLVGWILLCLFLRPNHNCDYRGRLYRAGSSRRQCPYWGRLCWRCHIQRGIHHHQICLKLDMG
ncbi:type IV conjugative transfer system protein TraG [Klebsiella pneumoniae]|uniref:Type IV conjugative transfer system protein TraG n=1 Tax=Klebsiella pneumoniae TaxID=573 RepID=A0A2X3EJL2_KLEPN|nr:type IV conjugative transfer system protein TraG [Klebsiella pneumoniae]